MLLPWCAGLHHKRSVSYDPASEVRADGARGPEAKRARITAECQKQLDAPGSMERFLSLGLEPAGAATEDFGEFLNKQRERFAAIARQANVRMD